MAVNPPRFLWQWLPLLGAAMLILPALPTLADQSDPRLDGLFELLAASNSGQVAAEAEIWRIWIESGREDIDALMAEGLAAMNNQQFDDAIDLFGQITRRAPEFAEGWNKRATAYFLNDEQAASVRDIRATLALEPRHFGAISGLGLIFLHGGDEEGALAAFEAVLVIHPTAPGARMRVQELRKKLGDRGA